MLEQGELQEIDDTTYETRAVRRWTNYQGGAFAQDEYSFHPSERNSETPPCFPTQKSWSNALSKVFFAMQVFDKQTTGNGGWRRIEDLRSCA